MNLAPTYNVLPIRTLAASLGMIWICASLAMADAPSSADVEFFETRIRPILVDRCVSCHGPEKSKGGLRLDGKEHAFKGGGGGAAIAVGDPDNSPLIQAVRYETDPKMPPKEKLSPQAVADLTEWVKRGAPWPETKLAAKTDPRKTHWAFQPIRNSDAPPVKNQAWASSPIDQFLLAKLEEKGLTPSPQADRRTLIRRATFDLTGLPPTA